MNAVAHLSHDVIITKTAAVGPTVGPKPSRSGRKPHRLDRAELGEQQGPPPDPAAPVELGYRKTPPAERANQITRLGRLKRGLDDPRLAPLSWFILRTAPNAETTATILLEMHGCAVFYPREAKMHLLNRYTKAKRPVWKPLTVGYLFVGFPQQPNWLRVLGWNSIAGVVGIKGKPMQAGFAEIVAFMRAHPTTLPPKQNGHMVTGREFAEGDLVEILSGPLAGEKLNVNKIKGSLAHGLLAFGFGATASIPLDNLGKLDD
ncbi:MAG: transcription termination/antitermination NusG family protein [Pseudomonadota bacterium]